MISTHTPLAGRDVTALFCCDVTTEFLLTRPLRDVTEKLALRLTIDVISTHTPLAGRDLIATYNCRIRNISTHTPLAGRDNIPA